MKMCKLHGCPDFRLIGVVFLQVTCQRTVVATAVWAVLSPANGGTAGAANVDVNVIVDVGGWRCQGTDCRRGPDLG